MRSLLLLPLLTLSLAAALAADPALTIYNQDFAVVRDTVTLDLHAGTSRVRFNDITTHLEPDSVLLRDPTGSVHFQVLEQNYRADPITQARLLSLFEGQSIGFLVEPHDGTPSQVVLGKIIRGGYVPRAASPRRAANNDTGAGEPIIEIDGKLRFSLPGQPLFPALADDTILQPTLTWKINSDAPAKLDAELGYITGGMTWNADYSVVAADGSDKVDLTGLVTMDNQSGKTFTNAKIKLMAGDVNKIQDAYTGVTLDQNRTGTFAAGSVSPGVTEKAFDEYHLYSLPRSTTLHDRETKQVEFVRAEGIAASTFYVYDGVKLDQNRYRGWGYDSIRSQSEYGTESNPKMWVMREFKNSEDNHLGLPLPKGRVRFYRRDADGQLEFTGENTIGHTPKDETVRAFTGDAFDLTGERRQTSFHLTDQHNNADESFEIKLRNHKKEPVEIRVDEHLYRWTNWDITAASDKWSKTDAQAVEFRVEVKPDEEKTVTYTVHYSW